MRILTSAMKKAAIIGATGVAAAGVGGGMLMPAAMASPAIQTSQTVQAGHARTAYHPPRRHCHYVYVRVRVIRHHRVYHRYERILVCSHPRGHSQQGHNPGGQRGVNR